jgi:hypothetical protein
MTLIGDFEYESVGAGESTGLSISAPFSKGTLWRTRGQEITDSGKVYQVEAEDPEGHPWLCDSF